MTIRATALAHALASAVQSNAKDKVSTRVGQNIRVGVGIVPVRHDVNLTRISALKYLGREIGSLARQVKN